MKEIFFLLLFLIPYSLNSYNVKKVFIDFHFPDILYTSTGNNYFYMEPKSENYDYPLYFYLSDESYGLIKYDYCRTSKYPYSDSTIEKCIFNSLNLEHYRSFGVTSQYYFKINIYSYPYDRYIIVRYSGSKSSGSLYAKSSYNDLYKLPDSTSRSFSTVNIVFTVIAALALIGIIITIICYYCQKKESVNATNASNEPIDEPIPTEALLPENEINPA